MLRCAARFPPDHVAGVGSSGPVVPRLTSSASFTYKRCAMEKRKILFALVVTAYKRCVKSSPCRRCSTPVSRSSSPPLVVSFCPENPLELTMLLPLFLQLEPTPLSPTPNLTDGFRRPPVRSFPCASRRQPGHA
jgi:hypothetical protein